MNPFTNPKSALVRGHDLLTRTGFHLQSFVLLAMRLTWGWQLLEAGYGHLTHIDKTVEAFRGWGIPFPELNVYLSGTLELTGGLLLVLGLAARLISIPLVLNFLVAFATASRGTAVQLFTGPQRLDQYDAVINDSAFPMLVLALTMLAFGPGRASLDHLLSRRLRKLLESLALRRPTPVDPRATLVVASS
jgi:putative oxidoreductase